MAYSKSSAFKKSSIKISVIGKALAHPARVSILKVLAKYGSCICNEIVAELPLSQSTVSQHLKELKNASLIIAEADGPRMTYSLNKEVVIEAEKNLQKLFKKII